jgi:hypothetical protein
MANKTHHIIVKRADGCWYLENSIARSGKEQMVYCSAFDSGSKVKFRTLLNDYEPREASSIRASITHNCHFDLWFDESGLLTDVLSDNVKMGCIRMDVNHELFKYIQFI